MHRFKALNKQSLKVFPGISKTQAHLQSSVGENSFSSALLDSLNGACEFNWWRQFNRGKGIHIFTNIFMSMGATQKRCKKPKKGLDLVAYIPF